MQEAWIQSLGLVDPAEKEMAARSSILAWRIPWIEESDGLQSMGSQRAGHDWVTNFHSFQIWGALSTTLTAQNMWGQLGLPFFLSIITGGRALSASHLRGPKELSEVCFGFLRTIPSLRWKTFHSQKGPPGICPGQQHKYSWYYAKLIVCFT